MNDNNIVSYNFRKARLDLLYIHLLSIDWSLLNESCDVNTACDLFLNFIFDSFRQFVPLKNCNVFNSRRYPPWFTAEIISNIRAKNNLLKKRRNISDYYESQIKFLSSSIHKNIRREYRKYICRIEQDLHSDPKTFWSFVNNTSKKPSLPNTMFYCNQTLDTPHEIVNAFAKLFASVNCDILQPTQHHTCNLPNYAEENASEFFTSNLILKASRSLKPNFTAGLDGIPSFLVKDCMSALAYPLSRIFNLSLNASVFPRA